MSRKRQLLLGNVVLGQWKRPFGQWKRERPQRSATLTADDRWVSGLFGNMVIPAPEPESKQTRQVQHTVPALSVGDGAMQGTAVLFYGAEGTSPASRARPMRRKSIWYLPIDPSLGSWWLHHAWPEPALAHRSTPAFRVGMVSGGRLGSIDDSISPQLPGLAVASCRAAWRVCKFACSHACMQRVASFLWPRAEEAAQGQLAD